MNGFSLPLFEALDCADHVVVDDEPLAGSFDHMDLRTRRLTKTGGDDLIVPDQPITIAGGRAGFKDAHGAMHSIYFPVEQPLDLARELPSFN